MLSESKCVVVIARSSSVIYVSFQIARDKEMKSETKKKSRQQKFCEKETQKSYGMNSKANSNRSTKTKTKLINQ